ncbi:hypothetical protein J437_LFUL012855 [Ladona fulva]|uniref:Endonuclease/exonuclease/phosphatase domain-containing protein n=1 Tax=Ladona fulva TaxID=123851 RepID=A0A8K0KDY9_LADFU|nr:hypothetical protein J437_LFUL012855 [Ladona fulva]
MLGRTPQAIRGTFDPGSTMRNGLPGSRNTQRKRARWKDIKIGTVNILSLSGKVEELIDFMEEKKIEILGLSETKWCGGGEKVLRLGYRLIWGGGREKKNGVAVIIRERMWGIVVEVVSGCKEEKIEDFLEILDNQIDDAPIVVMGDLNAQVGMGRTGCEEIIGPHGYGKRNKEGDCLIDFCRRNNLFVGNTWFRKKPSRKITRYGWGDKHTKTLIDYVLIECEYRRELIDVTVMPEEEFGRDHRAVVFKMRVGALK